MQVVKGTRSRERCECLQKRRLGHATLVECSVALFLEAFARQRKVEETGFDFAEAPAWKIIVAGSALNSRGQSSSLTTPSGPAMQDLIHSALKEFCFLRWDIC
eukprot:s673_g13.t1